MSFCEIRDYKGVKIVYTDIKGTSGDEAIPTFEKVQGLVQKFPDKSVLSCVNATDARFNKNLLSTIKDTVKKNNPKSKATTVCGLNKLSTVILKSIISATGRQMRLFDTVEEGMEWLVEYEAKSAQKSMSA
ncbi:hypothetical protein GCM10027429_20260 [Marivirga atlantica]|jgi:hypothetical protein|uniref:STAS/SEC14 domain-containing protein n=1 Tax=Marivirga atlantica TaxID=1548457 RepID=A0A937AFP6_9BACT|nr:hypothetical protein [Marivirga atlantica]MBL0765644.1 hypothetical protein [Marivirga atlantica]